MSMPHRMTDRSANAMAFSILVISSLTATVSAQLKGTVQLGGNAGTQPRSRVKVTLYEATDGKPKVVGKARTNHAGQFEIDTAADQSSSIFFVTADLGFGVEFVTVLGEILPSETTINELTTVAASYSMAQFYRKGYISGDSFGLRIAAGMNDNLVATPTGESSPVLLTSPNADETNSLRMTRSLSNLLGACVRYPWLRAFMCYLTTPPGGKVPRNMAVALANLARNPGQNVQLIYLLSFLQRSYSPALLRVPDAWTVTVKVNDSGDDNFLFGGPSNVAFDSRGYAWVANNVVQGTPVSANHIMVLQPNGKPADGGLGLPTSPVKGGGILGVGWGIAVDPLGTVWIGNFGWGGVDPTQQPPGSGSVSTVSSDGTPLSLPDGFFEGTYRVQGIRSDNQGNIWASSFGTNSVFVFPNGNPFDAKEFVQYDGSQPFGMAIDVTGAAWVTNSGGLAGLNQSSVAKFELTADGTTEQTFLTNVGTSIKVIDVDSQGNAWIASQGDNKIYGVRSDGTLIGGFTGGGISGPWGLTVDGDDNIWVGNFGPLEPGDFNTGGVSKLCGVNQAAWPPGKKLGDPLSPETGYTLHSAGSQVLLHDGTPLNGVGSEPVFVPLMRQTSVVIDQGGNLWSINNWKPRFSTDILLFDTGELVANPGDDANPGGDGIVIFVGLAPPRPRPY